MKNSRKTEKNPVDLHIGKQIKFARTIKRWSQAELATQLGVSGQQVAKYEDGSNSVSPDKLKILCDTLEVPLSQMFMDEKVDNHPFFTSVLHKAPNDVSEAELFELVSLFSKIKSSETRQLVLNLLKTIRRDAK